MNVLLKKGIIILGLAGALALVNLLPISSKIIQPLQLKSGNSRYGLVRVIDENKKFVKNYRITAEELDILNASSNGYPPGITKDEWETGRVVVWGISMRQGDVEVMDDGTIRILYYEGRTEQGEETRHMIVLKTDEYTGTPPNISVSDKILEDAFNVIPDINRPSKLRILNGEAIITK